MNNLKIKLLLLCCILFSNCRIGTGGYLEEPPIIIQSYYGSRLEVSIVEKNNKLIGNLDSAMKIKYGVNLKTNQMNFLIKDSLHTIDTITIFYEKEIYDTEQNYTMYFTKFDYTASNNIGFETYIDTSNIVYGSGGIDIFIR